MKFQIFLILLLGHIWSWTAQAEDRLALAMSGDMDELFSLSLKELVNLDVSTVSKRDESLLDAPGVVTVITADDIKTYGATNLKDVLLRLPNFYMLDSATFKASGMMLRAGATQHLNNHVLYLVNGRPLRESQNGGLHTDMNLLFPIDMIDRIEVIRGPGSVLYGSNAYSGTLNIITKTATEDFQVSFKTQNGSNEYSSQTLSLGSVVTKDIEIALHANILDYDGEFQTAQDEADTTGKETTGREGSQIFLDVDAYGFRLNGFKNEIDVPAVSGRFVWGGKAIFELKRSFYDIGYENEILSGWRLSANFSHNKQDRIILEEDGGSSEFRSDGHLSELSITGELADNLNMIAGGIVDVIKGNLGTRGGKYETERQALYGQMNYQMFEDTRLTAGLQWNKPQGVDADISPRLALVHHYDASFTFKTLYAKAFRSPYGSELFFDAGFLLGDENLNSETIQTIEAQAIYSAEALSGSLTLYYSEADDLIGRQVVDGTPTFVNESEVITYNGIELEWNWQIQNSLRFQGNASYQTNEDESGQQDVMVAANEMIKLGITYRPNLDLTLGIWNSYFGAANKLEDLDDNSTVVVNPSSEAVNLLSLNLSSNLGYLLDKPSLESFNVSLFVNNLLDEEIWYPELGQQKANTFPQSHEQGIFASLKYTFK